MNSFLTRQPASNHILAVSSTLSTRTISSIPPASHKYEPLVKAALARRFVYNVLSASAIAAWALAVLWTYWQSDGLERLGLIGWVVNWLSPLTLFYAIVFWSFASAPVAVLRKMFSRAFPSPSLSPRRALSQCAWERSHQHALLVLLLSSSCLALVHASVSQIVEKGGRGDPKLGIWAGSKKHPYHINGRLCFLFLSQSACALFYWLRDVLKDRFSIHWSFQSDQRLALALPLLFSSLLSTLILSATSTVASLLVFGVLRSTALPIVYRLPIIHDVLRPFIAHFLRPTFTITFVWSNLDIIFRAFFLALTTQILWDVPSTVFEVVFSFPAVVTEAQTDSSLILVSGISSSDSYFQLHAIHELYLLASDSSQNATKRSAIYNDAKHNPSLWASLLRRSLLLLGADYQLFLRRGDLAPPPTFTGVTVTKQLTKDEKSTANVIRTQVYKPSHPTSVERLADTLSSLDALPKGLNLSARDSFELSRLFVPNRVWSYPGTLWNGAPNVSAVVSSFLPPSWVKFRNFTVWWSRERRDKAAQKALPHRELDIMIIQVLSRLVSHSLQEDTIGSVQRDIPRVLEALVLFLFALEEYQTELSTVAAAARSSDVPHFDVTELNDEIALASEWVEGLAAELRTGISLIVSTFGGRLTKFKFPQKIAMRIQQFVDYSV